MCDDGNTLTGDGCDGQCRVETGYVCRGGLDGGKDQCQWIPTEIKRVEAGERNTLIVEFTRPVQMIGKHIF